MSVPALPTPTLPLDLTGLLGQADLSFCAGATSTTDIELHDRLINARLGVAAGLFRALRARHAPTAQHCLRVALVCSAWCRELNLPAAERDEIELAALLHEVGKLGLPDTSLSSAERLPEAEPQLAQRQARLAREILSDSCAPRILDMILQAAARFDEQSGNDARSEDQLPLGSRMIAIADRFDWLRTEPAAQPSRGREQVMAELERDAGSRLDPQLVRQFVEWLGNESLELRRATAARWLQELSPELSHSYWQRASGGGLRPEMPSDRPMPLDRLFYQKLLENLNDGVVIVDPRLRILVWSPVVERLTGIQACGVQYQPWTPSLVELRDERGGLLTAERCPVALALQSGVQSKRRLSITGRNGKQRSVDARVVPVFDRDGKVYGATLVLHDASSRITLEERVQMLHERATRDPLTQVANRAEFDRVLKQFIDTHLEQETPCSLIICDLDRFKRINDVYGHQAGDEALVSFARLLRRTCRPADLVARYGGEEFVMLCADCDNATATQRAEQLRRELADIPQSSLDGQCLTASFGVTEIQPGDSPETMLRRADRALLAAKDSGRNRVVQLGGGIGKAPTGEPRGSWFGWWHQAPADELVEKQLVTAVPLKVAIEKLRGFVADQHAEISSVEDQRITLQIGGGHSTLLRRSSDRPVPYQVTLTFSELRPETGGLGESRGGWTLVRAAVRPKRNRDRRRTDAMERARQLVASLQSYLMAQEYLVDAGPGAAASLFELAQTPLPPITPPSDENDL